MMQNFLIKKLDVLTNEFIAGPGDASQTPNGMAYESQYLAYLECLVAFRNGPRSIYNFWSVYRGFLGKRTPIDQPIIALCIHTRDRQKLVDALQDFQRMYDGPETLPPKASKKAHLPKTTRSDNEDGGILDMFGVLPGTEEDDTP